MQRKRGKQSIKLIVLIAVLSLLILSQIYFVGRGFNRIIQSQQQLHAAQASWQEGDVLRATSHFLKAAGMSLEGQIRWSIAQNVYLSMTGFYYRNGQLEKALQNCTRGVQVLGAYDNEGSVGYICSEIHIKIVLSKGS